MTERYSFTVDRHLVPNISVDGSVVWSQDNLDHSSLTDTINEGYVTAEEDTQYLSVLDSTSEISLENLNITLTNPKLEEVDEAFITNEDLGEQAPEEANEQQVVVYSVEGSDDLYGIQVAQDEEGNLQKYQFQFRKNKEGQFEAILETIQLLPMEDGEGNVVENLEPQQETILENDNAEMEHSMHIFVQEDNSSEHILPDRNTLGEPEENASELYEDKGIEEMDIKPGILTLQNVKQETHVQHHLSYAEPIDEDSCETYLEEENSEPQMLEYIEPNSESDSQEEDGHVSYEEKPCEEDQFEHIEVNPDMDVNQENGQELEESDVDDNYQIVEGVHITGDVEAAPPSHEEPAAVEKTVTNTNILKHALRTNKEIKTKKDNRLYLYVVQHPEKENVDSLAVSNLCKPLKANPRSILKSSFAVPNRNEEVLPSQVDKRFARCKEAVQARIFHNFINKTTIPQAPVRKDRLPRKQKIKPVERMDEEIVVQEVMVSNNGFVETVGGGVNKENLEVTEYVELSDSDDDYDPKRTTGVAQKKKKKHKRKRMEITISDDSDDDEVSSVIDLDESEEEMEENTPTKRRRGRPPKNPTESPSKKPKAAGADLPEKPEIPCPKCEKTFPSQNSLKTHLQHHSLQNSLKNAVLPEYKYKCDACANTFKNAILLKRHQCLSFVCTVCKKKFPDQGGLNQHKRIHAKEQLLKTTTLPPVSPKKSTTLFKMPPPKKTTNLKCKTCSRLCSSLQNLNIHMKTHKEYACATCSSKFLSQLALEKHLRENCVKSPRRSMRKEEEKMKRLTPIGIKVACTKCDLQFPSLQLLFRHQVKNHGLDTPDKSILQEDNEKKTLHKEKKAYGGIPAAKKLQDAYANLRCKLNFQE